LRYILKTLEQFWEVKDVDFQIYLLRV
jgi:hypothetical protein